MRNGYFKIVRCPQGFGVKLFPAKDGGEAIRMLELMNYLEPLNIPYEVGALRRAVESGEETVFFLAIGECPSINEEYNLDFTPDNMVATVRFYPPSDTGKRMAADEFIRDLRFRNVNWGIQTEIIQKHFETTGFYCTDLLAAKGQEPRHGKDAQIEYFFNTDVHIQPTVREDGSVDYFHLNVINHCKKGDMLARIIPADEGEPGMNIQGNRIKPRDVRKLTLKFGNNIELSEDRLSITSKVDGHVVLVEDKVFVSDVYEVENVDLSTGNIDFEGSVQVNGNVANNMHISARGNVIINGVVEGAHIEAGGNIIIARGMNGMSKGVLRAGGNIVAKFLENATAFAEGYINTESILHSNVVAGTQVSVTGKKGFITGGHVQAADRIEVKTLGSPMGAMTVVEVGVNPQLKEQYIQLQKEVTEIVKIIKAAQPVIANFAEKRAKGVRFSEEQVKYIKSNVAILETKKVELEQKNKQMKEIQASFDTQKNAEIVVQGVVCPGTNIVISDVSMVIQSSYKYCKFQKQNGDVKMLPL